MQNQAPNPAPPVVGNVAFGPNRDPRMNFDALADAASRSISMGEQLVKNQAAIITDQANRIHTLETERERFLAFTILLLDETIRGNNPLEWDLMDLLVSVADHLTPLGLNPETKTHRAAIRALMLRAFPDPKEVA